MKYLPSNEMKIIVENTRIINNSLGQFKRIVSVAEEEKKFSKKHCIK